MKQIKKNESGILKISSGRFIIYSIVFLLAVAALIFQFKTKMIQASVVHPSGKKENIRIPFDSHKEGQLATYTYALTLQHTALSSGKFHIIPDDCIEEISINGKAMTDEQFPKGNCDCINGFYLDLKLLLDHGDNVLQFKVRNTRGFYGLSIKDQTLYEKYILGCYFLLLLCTVNLRFLYRRCSFSLIRFFSKNRVLTCLWLFLLFLFASTLAGTFYLDNLKVWFWVLIAELLLLVFIPFVYQVYRRFTHGKIIALVWVVMMLVFTSYLLLLSHTLYSYDYQGHIDYVHYIVNYAEAPVSWGAWSFYHPSLYYRCTAGLWNLLNLSDRLSNADFLKTMQAFSLLLFTAYCYCSLKTIDLFFRELKYSFHHISGKVMKWIHISTAILFLCWPSNSIFAVRIGNDMMFDLLFAISFYFTLKWWQSSRTWYFFLALVFAVLDIWSKTNGFILLGLIGFLLIVRYINTRSTFPAYKFILLVSFSMLSLYYSFHERVERLRDDPKTKLVVGNANGLGSDLIVKSDLQSFIAFDPLKFVEIPFTSSYDDTKGRNSFWFFLLKSSLFGEFQFDTAVLATIARIISFLFLLIVALAAGGWFQSILKGGIYFPMAANVCIMIGAMMVFRVLYPYSSSSDFRYIFPALLPAVLFAGVGVIWCTRWKMIYYPVILIYVFFITAAVAFQIAAIC